MSSRFCEQCGGVIAAEDRFCGTCGSPVEIQVEGAPPPEPAPAFLSSGAHSPVAPGPEPVQSPAPAAYQPVQYQPTSQPSIGGQPAASGSGPSLGLLIGGLLVVLIILGGGGWYGWNLYTKSLGKPPVAGKDAANPGTAKPGAQSASGQAAAPASQDGDRFLGLWAPEKQDDPTKNQEISFVRQGSLLVGTTEFDKTGSIELNVGPGDKLEGVCKQSGSADIPVTAELLNDGKRMVLTLAPPQSEFDTVILLKVNEAEKAAAQASQNSGADEIPGIVPISGVDEAYAQKVVSQQKEVKEFLNLLAQKGKNPRFDIEEEDANTWMVRVYEIVEDGDGMSHSATFGWYKVDRTTAAVSPGM